MAIKECMYCRNVEECVYEVKSPCASYIPRKGEFKLAEMALLHPSSLNKALSALPFKTWTLADMDVLR